ncbi:translocation/assembly module TamB domain-containing protein [Sphingobacterium bambusae]|uniref:Translocation/assembly module TamB domain-containing protein n=1 Tax=Sphingobacterium bambusae TaxID=662858 RepID=A0ABW6BMA3_9SPHI|nr:translocation/assembly module TamB domain-containing protein [Sphingobacterium bambusae]WPL47712.1 translocation/assembly module TamB domain-containing protein [Sphingobacterium bambusae]
MNRFGRIALKTILWIIGSVIALILLIIFLIRIPAVQNYVVGKVTNYLETKIGTPVSIGYVNITFPKKLVLENVYFEDQSKDTLIAGEKLLVDINMFKLLKNTVEIEEFELEGITAKISRTLPDSSFNFDYIMQAFTSEKESTPTSDSSSALVFNIEDVLFKRIHFVYNDEVIGTSADIRLNHFDTRVKKFELTNNMAFSMPDIKIDGLTAVVKQWQPVSDTEAPSAADLGITDSSAQSSSLLPDLEIKNIDLSNIFVSYADAASKMDTKFDIKRLQAGIKELDLNKEIVRLEEVALDESDSQILFGKTSPAATKTTATDTEQTASSMNWVVSADRLVINKTNVWFKDDNQARMKGFDYGNIKITNFLGELEDLYYSTDSISGSLQNLSMKDHSGFTVKKLQADFVYGSKGAEIKNLLAQTPYTTIRDYVKITYPSLDAISTNPNLVNVDAKIRKTTIDMRDIRYFVPDLDTMQVMKPLLARSFYIDGTVRGKMDNLTIPNIEFKTLDRTQLVASAIIKGLPDMEKLNVDLKLKKFTTGRGDIERLVDKSMLPDSIQLPNAISLSGTFKGGMKGFDTNLSLVTEKGNATVNGKMSMGRDTTYNAYVSVDNFNLGNILNQDSVLGIISVEAKVEGTGLNPKNMNATVEGNLNQLDAMGYTYRNIKLDAQASGGDIAGSLVSPDPNIQLNMDFAADMRGTYPKVQATLMIDSINLQNLKLMDQNFRYHGKIVADLETADPDFLNGSVIVSNSSIAYENDRYTLDTIALRASADSNRNTLVLNSEFLRAHLVGKYKLTQLGNSIQDIVQMYYNPKGEPATTLAYDPQNFEFSATLNNSRFIRDFLPDLEEMRDVTLDGTFDSESKSIMAKLIAPKILYGGTLIENVGVDLTTADSTLYYSALINRIKVNTIELTNTVFSGSVVENNLDFGLWIKDKAGKEQYHLGAGMQVADNNYALRLKEDGLVLHYEKWSIDTANQISFGSQGLRADSFRLTNKGQEFLIQSKDSSSNAPIDLTFNNFRIETLTQIVESEALNLGGGINGTATISRLESSPVFVSDLNIEKFYFGKDTVGNVAIQVNNIQENTFAADIKISENGNDVQLIGNFISPPNAPSSIDATLSLKPMKMTTIQAFSLGYIEDAAGDLVGDIKITGTVDQPRIDGALTFQQAKMNIGMLNADLLMDNQAIRFNNQGIQFRQFTIKDSRGNATRLNGSIRTTTYTDFDFNLNISMDDFAAVNSTREDNDLFFGKLYLTSNLRITGNLDNPRVDGDIRVNDKTDFNFIVPNDDPGLAQRDGVVKFVNRSDTARANVFAQLDSLTTATKLSGYDIALNLSTDRDAKFKVILDEGTKDALNIQGIAEINTTIDASDKITMSGTYTVEKGDYTFSLGPISRPFTFQKGSTITWNGDPLDARLDITAVYRNRFSTLELVQSQVGSESQNLYKQRIPFDVKLILTGELFKPQINFDIDLDENNAIASQDVVSKVNIALSNIRSDPAELNKQVFSLIALGRFMSSNPFESLSGGGGAEGLARSTVSSFLTGQLNNLASDLVKGVELDFNLQSEEDYLTGNAQTRTDLNVGVSKMLFDDRLKITIGSNFEVEGNSRPGEKASNIAGDVSLDYQLSKDGRYFARVYRKNQYQATLQGQFVETGLGFIITMSYDRFKELFMNSKALQQYYDTDSKGFRRRFDVERMDSDSVYRDSVRLVIRDSLMQHSPEFRKRMQERQKQQNENKKDSTKSDAIDTTARVIRKEDIDSLATKEDTKNARKDSTKTTIDAPKNAIRNEDEERNANED